MALPIRLGRGVEMYAVINTQTMTVTGQCTDTDFERYGTLPIPPSFHVIKIPDGLDVNHCDIVETENGYTLIPR